MAKTLNEQIIDLTHTLTTKQAEADTNANGGAWTSEDSEAITKMANDLNGLMATAQAKMASGDSLSAAGALGLGDDVGDADPDHQPEIDSGSGIVNPKGMTLGEAFVKSPAFEGFIKNFQGADGMIRDVKNVTSERHALKSFRAGIHGKDLVTGASDTSAGALVQAQRLAGITDTAPARELLIRDLCTNVPTTSDLFEYVQITGKTNNAATVAEATTSDDIGSGDPVVTEAQAGLKPESALTFTVKASAVETIAHLIPITRRAAGDAGQVLALINQFLLDGLGEKEEDQFVSGDGSSPNLRGILNTVGIQTRVAAGTDLDSVAMAIRDVRVARRRPTALVVNPLDWYTEGFLLAKDANGHYQIANPLASIDQIPALWGLQVVVSDAVPENTAIVGDFRQAVVADRMQSSIYMTDSHKDWFARNMLAILAEERVGFGVLDPAAFCTITAV